MNLGQIIPGDIFASPKYSLMGVMLKQEFLILNSKTWLSFRIRPENIIKTSPFRIRRAKYAVDENYLESYFSANRDNPYALYNVLSCLGNGRHITDLTQLPPLYFNKDITGMGQSLRKMAEQSEGGDMVCIYRRDSRVSGLIRKIDKGYWSHVGLVAKDKKIHHMTTEGMRVDAFDTFKSENIDIGLYRIKNGLDESAKSRMLAKLSEIETAAPTFGWVTLIPIILQKYFRLPIGCAITPADMIYSNELELIGFA